MVNDKLPNGWVETYIGELGEVISGGTPSTRNNENFGGYISWVTPADLTGYKDKYISKGKRNITLKGLKKSSARIMPKGTILFSSRAPIGYTVIASNRISTNQGFKSLVPCLEYINSEYIYYTLKNSKQIAESLASGTTFKEISGSNFKKIPILLPPLNEQKRIVTKIEKLFASLDNSDKQLVHLEKQLKRYRQSVLKSAFEGELTREWRKEEGELESADVLLGKIKEEKEAYYIEQLMLWKESVLVWEKGDRKGKKPSKPRKQKELKTSNSSLNLNSWLIISLESITTLLGDGLHGTPKYTDDSEYYFVNGNNLNNGNIIIKNDTKTVSKTEYETYKKDLNENSILVSINGTLGNIAFFNNEKIMLGKSACYFNILESINKYYIFLKINSQEFKEYAGNSATGSTIQNVPLSAMRNYMIPLPTIEEQNQIVLQIEKHFSMIDKLESVVQTSIKESKRLRQSILKQAFEGKLVEQDSSDESAELLLKKIAKAKAVYAEALKKKREKR